jgi:hypothetical protein
MPLPVCLPGRLAFTTITTIITTILTLSIIADKCAIDCPSMLRECR